MFFVKKYILTLTVRYSLCYNNFTMRLIKSNDFYSVKVRGYVTSLHLEVLDILYQPIMGFAATALYRYLFTMRDFRKGRCV